VLKNEIEIVRTPVNKEMRYRQVSAAPVKDGEGNIIGSISVVRDITELKELQNRLQKHSEDLERLVEERTKQLKDSERLAAIGATAGMVGHDIRNPLQAITSDVYLIKTELALTPESDEKNNANESLTEIEKNIDYINKIVQDLQDYARPLQPIAKGTSLENLCQEIFLKSNIPNNIKTSFKAEKEAKEVFADPDLLKRIISNLVLNAVQAMPKGGNLSIYAHRKEGGLVIEVQDTGEGIPTEAKPKLFTPMFTTKSKGQGFGLAVVKRITESMNGTVTFESEQGKGTKFTVRLPPPPRS
jgi:signal transduction histidine kinase